MELLDATSLHRTDVRAISFSPDGAVVASADSGGTIAIVVASQFASGAAASLRQPGGGRLLGGGVSSLAFHPERPVLVTVGGLKNAVLWDVTSARDTKAVSDLSRIRQGIWGPWGCAIAPGGKVLAIGGAGNTIALVDVSDARQPRLPDGAIPGPRPSLKAPRARKLAFHPSGVYLTVGSGDGTLTVWDTARLSSPRRVTVLPAHSGTCYSVSYAPDGGLCATAGFDDRTVIWDVADHEMPRLLAAINGQNAPAAAFSPVAPLLAIADGTAGNGSVSLWDISMPSRPAQATVAATKRVSALAWSPDGLTLAAGDLGGTTSLWRI